MKSIKKISTIVFLISFSLHSFGQNAFNGTWEWENESQIFRVFLWENDQGAIKGHFEMVETDSNGAEIIIYTSDKPYNAATPEHWHPVINAGIWHETPNELEGRIMDNSLDYEDPELNGYQLWQAWLEMKIISENPTQATWKVNYKDIVPENALPINIPMDIVMTKVE